LILCKKTGILDRLYILQSTGVAVKIALITNLPGYADGTERFLAPQCGVGLHNTKARTRWVTETDYIKI